MINVQPYIDKKLPNIDLGKTQITDKIRVSSAAIFYEEIFGSYYQLETFIFSDDKERQPTKMQIHCTTGVEIPQSKIDWVKTFHRRVSKMLLKKFNNGKPYSKTSETLTHKA